MTTEPARASLRRLLRLLRPQWPLLAAMLLLDLLLVPVALLLPLPLKIAIDCAIRGAALPGPLQAIAGWWPSAEPAALALGLATALVVVVAVARHLGELASAWLHAVAGERMVFALRQRLFDRSQRLSLAWHDAHGTADAVFRIHWDVPSVQHITVDGLLPLLLAACTVAGMIAVTAAIDWPLALIAMLVAPALIALVWVYRLPLRRHWRDARDHDASAQGIVQEVLAALRVVRAFGKEDDESARFVRTAGLGMRARLRLALVQGRFELLAGLCTALGTAAVLWFGVRHVQQGRLTLGDLLVVMAYLAMLYAPLRTISSKAADVQASLGGLDRALALLDAPPDIVERPAARPLPRATSRSPTRPGARHCRACRSRSRRAAASASRGRPAPASRRW
jgi:ATP-binding cassette subfamily B protein